MTWLSFLPLACETNVPAEYGACHEYRVLIRGTPPRTRALPCPHEGDTEGAGDPRQREGRADAALDAERARVGDLPGVRRDRVDAVAEAAAGGPPAPDRGDGPGGSAHAGAGQQAGSDDG